MKTYTMISKGGETVELYSDNTFTLALGSPETEIEESTPELLASCFSPDDLMRLCAEVGEFSQEGVKITAALALGGAKEMRPKNGYVIYPSGTAEHYLAGARKTAKELSTKQITGYYASVENCDTNATVAVYRDGKLETA